MNKVMANRIVNSIQHNMNDTALVNWLKFIKLSSSATKSEMVKVIQNCDIEEQARIIAHLDIGCEHWEVPYDLYSEVTKLKQAMVEKAYFAYFVPKTNFLQYQEPIGSEHTTAIGGFIELQAITKYKCLIKGKLAEPIYKCLELSKYSTSSFSKESDADIWAEKSPLFKKITNVESETLEFLEDCKFWCSICSTKALLSYVSTGIELPLKLDFVVPQRCILNEDSEILYVYRPAIYHFGLDPSGMWLYEKYPIRAKKPLTVADFLNIHSAVTILAS